MKVFLDTNVLASALGTRGLCADILRQVVASEELVVSDPLLDELRRILVRKFDVSVPLMKELVAFLVKDTIHAPPGDLLEVPIKDKDDIVILSSAIHGKANAFVTGDKEVLALKTLRDMEILSPRDFWTKLSKRKA